MNKITLRGVIRNIASSHKINDVEYNKADIIVKRKDGKEDIITVCYKKLSCKYTEDETVSLVGNIRSYSKKLEDKNKVSVYVFTYGDIPSGELESFNKVELDGRVCKIDKLRKVSDGNYNLHLILANNIIIEKADKKINSYIPVVLWGKQAKDFANLQVGDQLTIEGELHSRYYKKYLENNDFEMRVAHEVVANEIELKDEKDI